MGAIEYEGIAGRSIGDMDDEKGLNEALNTHGNLLFAQGYDAFPRQG